MDIFDIVQDGTYNEFIESYNGDITQIDKYTKLNLLCTAMLNNNLPEEKLKIIKYLLSEKVEVNFLSKKENRNALHYFFQANWWPKIEYAYEVAKLLIEAGIDVNAVDKFGSIPMTYSVTLLKLATEELEPLYMLLLEAGSDYKLKNKSGKSCLDYAKEYSWRSSLLDIIKDYEEGRSNESL
ncbi:ankyrin repeat domain-containing protein [Streptococcus sanguinis]|jgi:conserved ankyrin repeat protein, putative|uniref:Ankyrin repeat-containing protein n=1 Tax=Streptococcus sanguinis SK408 TaxID=888818 RepID=F2CCH8_STRSA|nr:ankyrin repeat domain-containing protein [Streptococcus sanguinis]EGF19758.1 ankyrin repeat-containing protein [Streptococcus sanguinis SK408]EGF21528.1 ankyrin repeat-containing protein [Streptococcus sanguinis SK1058]